MIFIFDLIQHPYFQRLRRISQMGLSYLVYPGANHTRFHHALGCMHLMQKAVDVLRFKNVILSEEEENWLTENRMQKNLPDWQDWKRKTSLESLSAELIILNRQTSSKMGKEQKLKFENWTRTIQETADKGGSQENNERKQR